MSSRPSFTKTLYGACYYNEYHPIERLNADFQDMRDGHLSVLRVGESVWSTWEPRDGIFNLDWLQPILDSAQRDSISVIIGMPTYAIPNWLRIKHPEVMADRKTGSPIPYGHRQNMDYSNPKFRFYAERIIRQIVERYKNHPAIIGWQVDNEPGTEIFHNQGVFEGFKEELKEKYQTVENLNKSWGLTYWSHSISEWDELWVPDGNTNNAYDLEWRKYQAKITDEYISWQAKILNELVPSGHFIMTCVAILDRAAQNIYSVAKDLDTIGVNVYYPTQDGLSHPYSQIPKDYEISGPSWMTMAGPSQVFKQADLAFSMLQDNFLVTETTATSTVHVNTAGLFPPYPGQLKQVALALVSRGANLVEYWHWHTLHYGAEMYWGGILGHNYQRGRTYEAFQDIGKFFLKQGNLFQDLKPESPVALVYSPESKWAMEFQPLLRKTVNGMHMGDPTTYDRIFKSFYEMFFDAGLGINIYGPNQLQDVDTFLKKHPILCVPGYFVAEDHLLEFFDQYAKKGGHLVLGTRTGYGTSIGTARTSVAPGILRKGAGVYYNESTNLNKPIKVKDDLQLGIFGEAFGWADLLIPEAAQIIARYQDPFLSDYAAVTSNSYINGKITTIGTIPNQNLGATIGNWFSSSISIDETVKSPDKSVTISAAFTQNNEKLYFVFNWGWDSAKISVKKDLVDLVTESSISANETFTLGSWGVAILR